MDPFHPLPWIEKNFREILPDEDLVLNMRYAGKDNFTGRDAYGGFKRCFLAPVAEMKFRQARELLARERPDLAFHVWDALRPVRVQKNFFDFLAGTPHQMYIAAPEPGSLHNFGMALDLSLQSRAGEMLDMGTDFDDFREIAQPRLEAELLRQGHLSPEQVANRRLLRDLMSRAGFGLLEHEWWHFNALPKEEVYGKHPRLE